MKKILLLCVSVLTFSQSNILDTLKEKTKNIGKQTPIDIEVYAKNPSTICSLKITNITNPYRRDLTEGKLEPIVLESGRYFRGDISQVRKGVYEFEYKWEKDGKFVDSMLKTIHIFAYHDIMLKFYKKVNLTFLLRPPKICR